MALLAGAGLAFIIAHFFLKAIPIATILASVIGGSFGLALTMGPKATIDSDDISRVGCAGVFGLLENSHGCLHGLLGVVLAAVFLIVH